VESAGRVCRLSLKRVGMVRRLRRVSSVSGDGGGC
jgi:hypothetical protein